MAAPTNALENYSMTAQFAAVGKSIVGIIIIYYVKNQLAKRIFRVPNLTNY